MIVVIADDFTGAAELGGLALRYDLSVEISSEIPFDSKADVLVIATDTRSMREADARRKMEDVCHDLKTLKPGFIYKKIDSVLRGHILVEIDVQCELLEYDHVLIVSANPGLKRTIVDGHYYLDQRPIHLTDFNHDPEFPIRSSHVADMLRTAPGNITTSNKAIPIASNLTVVADVRNANDLHNWSKIIEPKTLVAGGAEFFDAVLQKLGYKKSTRNNHIASLFLPALMVFGSSYRHHKHSVSDFANADQVCYVPASILDNDWDITPEKSGWIEQAVTQLDETGKALIATKPGDEFSDPIKLRNRIAEACAAINRRIKVNEWLIEGGATAATILETLHVKSLYPLQELAPGVIRMGASQGKQIHFTLKPGSYEWPESILSLTKQHGYKVDKTMY